MVEGSVNIPADSFEGRISPEMRRFRLEGLSIHEQLVVLAPGIEARDPRAREMATLVLMPVVDKVSRTRCGPLSHRGGRCGGALDPSLHAYGAIREALNDQLVGAEGGPRAKVLDWIAEPLKCTLEQFAFGRMLDRDAREAWNRERGLVQRPRGVLIDRFGEVVAPRLASAPRAVQQAAAVLGFEPTHAPEWLEALCADACQTALEEIDAARLRRALGLRVPGCSEDEVDELVAEVAHFLDGCFSSSTPEAYDKYLARPRSQTRVASPDGHLDGAPGRVDPNDVDVVAVVRLAGVVVELIESAHADVRELLSNPAVTEPCGFEPDDLSRLRALDKSTIESLLRSVLSDAA